MLASSAAAAARSGRRAAVASFAQMQQVRNASKDIRFGSDARMQMLAGASLLTFFLLPPLPAFCILRRVSMGSDQNLDMGALSFP